MSNKLSTKLIDIKVMENPGKKTFYSYVCETNNKKFYFSSFDAELAQKSRNLINQNVDVEYNVNDKGFMSLVTISLGSISSPLLDPKGSFKSDPTTMYVSYAKDIYIALLNKDKECKVEIGDNQDYMDIAIMMIKKAKKEFETK